MKLRDTFLPKDSSERFLFFFVILIIPWGVCMELYYVLPALCPRTSWWYTVHETTALFLTVNILSNFVFIMMADTSVKGAKSPVKVATSRPYCSRCHLHQPPRSWHCHTCDTCILKRDHHCKFTGCCIGYRNQRYFFFFLLFTGIGLTYTVYMHGCFVHQRASLFVETMKANNETLKMAFARTFEEVKKDYTLVVRYFILYYFIPTASVPWMIAAVVSTCFFGNAIAHGVVLYEMAKDIRDYDAGLRANVVQALGERWYLAWISPLVPSPLPGDGFHWAPIRPREPTQLPA